MCLKKELLLVHRYNFQKKTFTTLGLKYLQVKVSSCFAKPIKVSTFIDRIWPLLYVQPSDRLYWTVCLRWELCMHYYKLMYCCSCKKLLPMERDVPCILPLKGGGFSPSLGLLATWVSSPSGLVTTIEVSGVTKLYLRERSRTIFLTASFSSPDSINLKHVQCELKWSQTTDGHRCITPHLHHTLTPSPEAVSLWGRPTVLKAAQVCRLVVIAKDVVYLHTG